MCICYILSIFIKKNLFNFMSNVYYKIYDININKFIFL